jgi:hypothetical protein
MVKTTTTTGDATIGSSQYLKFNYTVRSSNNCSSGDVVAIPVCRCAFQEVYQIPRRKMEKLISEIKNNVSDSSFKFGDKTRVSKETFTRMKNNEMMIVEENNPR